MNIAATIPQPTLSRCIPLCLLSFGMLLGQCYASEHPAADQQGFSKVLKPYLQQHCYRCHGSKKQKAGLNLESFDGDMIKDDSAETWVEAIHLIEAGEMPPAKEPQPTRQVNEQVITWLRAELERSRQVHVAKNSDLSLRRLSNLEYRQSVRSLFETAIDVPDEMKFLEDTAIDGFRNLTDSLDLTSMHLQQYMRAAEHMVDRILATPKQKPALQRWTIIVDEKNKGRLIRHPRVPPHDGLQGKNMKKVKKGVIPLPKKPLTYAKAKGKRHAFSMIDPREDLRASTVPYRMIEHTDQGDKQWEGYSDIRVYSTMNRKETRGRARLGWRWFGYDEGLYKITYRLSGFSDPRLQRGNPTANIVRLFDGKLMGSYTVPIGETREFSLVDYAPNVRHRFNTSGSRYFGYDLLIPSWRTLDKRFMPSGLSAKDKKDYLKNGFPYGIGVDAITIEGPLHEQWPPPIITKIFLDRQAAETDTQYAERILANFATLSWRRPAQTGELAHLMTLFKHHDQDASFKKRLRLPLVAILASPQFYTLSRPTVDMGEAAAARSLADRLAYFLTRTAPDAALRASAADGSILDKQTIASHAQRLLQSTHLETFCRDFANSWFGLENIHDIGVNRRLYPSYGEGVKESMLAETYMVMQDLMKNNKSIFELLQSDWTYLNARLAKHYGIDGITHDAMKRVRLKPEHKRGSILAHGSIQTLTSNGVRTSPIHRGVFVLEHILGTKPPPPAPNVPALEDAKAPRPDATIRELLEQHRRDPNCSSCHMKIDPLGFAMENYNAVGQWRTHEYKLVEGKRVKTHAVDVRGQLSATEQFSGLHGLRDAIVKDGDRFRRCVIKKLLTYALDKEPTFVEEDLIDDLLKQMKANGDRIQDLIIAIVCSNTFRGVK